MPFIDYMSEDFPAGYLAAGWQLDVSWGDILWAAITVGRPSLFHVFQHGDASVYEAILRLSMIRMALHQRGPTARRFVRTEAFKRMDPTEKGAINYFLGLVTCKLFASRLLDAPWTLHLDVWKDQLSISQLGGRSRPDMVAQCSASKEWFAFECKGRASIPGNSEKTKAKAQAQRLVSVGMSNCTLHVGSIAYYKSDVLEFYWRDPEPTTQKAIEVPQIEEAWASYYLPFLNAYRVFLDGRTASATDAVEIEQLDIGLLIHPAIVDYLLAGQWERARVVADEYRAAFLEAGYQADGLLVKAGNTWRDRRKAERPIVQ